MELFLLFIVFAGFHLIFIQSTRAIVLAKHKQKIVYSNTLRPKMSFFRKDLSMLLPGSWHSRITLFQFQRLR